MTIHMRHTDQCAEIIVDLDAIAHNTALIADTARTTVMAVVKADAFGHGLVPVARTVLAHGAHWLGVTTCTEALRLRHAGITAPVLSWMHTHDTDFAAAIDADIDLSASSTQHLDQSWTGTQPRGERPLRARSQRILPNPPTRPPKRPMWTNGRRLNWGNRVGVTGFEPAASSSRILLSTCADRSKPLNAVESGSLTLDPPNFLPPGSVPSTAG
jgi:Alanine racemase, N-terminal domain